MADKKTGLIFYKVNLIKSFTYPKAMLERGYEEEDARNKALNDIYKTINEIANNKFEDIDTNTFFESTIEEDKGWQLRNSKSDKSIQVELEDIIAHFAQLEFEKKYGILNIEENPDLFEFKQGVQKVNTNGDVVSKTEDTWFLKEDYECKLEDFKNAYRQKLKKFSKNAPVKKSRFSLSEQTERAINAFRRPNREPTITTSNMWRSTRRPIGLPGEPIDESPIDLYPTTPVSALGNEESRPLVTSPGEQLNASDIRWRYMEQHTYNPTIFFVPNPALDSPQEARNSNRSFITPDMIANNIEDRIADMTQEELTARIEANEDGPF